MRNHRITDEQAAALLNGHVPEAREDLQHVAAVVGTLRPASYDAPPQPSAALAARLDLDRLAWVSATRGTGVPACDAEWTAVLSPRPAKGKVRKALGWFTGLGLAAQIALGAGAVSASAAGIGMAGALPPTAQQVFDAVVSAVATTEQLFSGQAASDAEQAPGEVKDDARTGVDPDTEPETDPADPDAPSPADAASPVEDHTGAASGPEPVVDEPATAVGPGTGNGRGNSGADAPRLHGETAEAGHPGNGNGNSGAAADKSSTPEKGGKPENPGQAKSEKGGKPENPGSARPETPGSGKPQNSGSAAQEKPGAGSPEHKDDIVRGNGRPASEETGSGERSMPAGNGKGRKPGDSSSGLDDAEPGETSTGKPGKGSGGKKNGS